MEYEKFKEYLVTTVSALTGPLRAAVKSPWGLAPPTFMLSLLGCLTYLALGMTTYGPSWWQSTCDPNGKFLDGLSNDNTNAWQTEYLLAITAGWGSMDFATAKAIVVFWNLIVGRGWQAATAWILYTVFRKYWVVELELLGCKISAEAAMSLQYETSSIGGVLAYARAVARCRTTRWPLRVSTPVLIVCVVYVLLVPTWISAMTGYTALSEPMTRLDDNTVVDPNRMKPCDAVEFDGERVGMANNTCISYTNLHAWDSVLFYGKPTLSCTQTLHFIFAGLMGPRPLLPYET